MKPGVVRGGHYHKDMDEKLMCVVGLITFELDNVKTVIVPGEIVDIPKNCVHTVYNEGNDLAVFVEFKDKEFNEKKDDTYTK